MIELEVTRDARKSGDRREDEEPKRKLALESSPNSPDLGAAGDRQTEDAARLGRRNQPSELNV